MGFLTQKQRQTDRPRQTQTDPDRPDPDRPRQIYRQTQRDRPASQPASHPASQPGRQAGRQADRQTDRHPDRPRQTIDIVRVFFRMSCPNKTGRQTETNRRTHSARAASSAKRCEYNTYITSEGRGRKPASVRRRQCVYGVNSTAHRNRCQALRDDMTGSVYTRFQSRPFSGIR